MDSRLAVLFRTNAELAEVESACKQDHGLQNLIRLNPGVSLGSDQFLDQFQYSREWLTLRELVAGLPEVVDHETLGNFGLDAIQLGDGALKHGNPHVLKAGRYLVRILAAAGGVPILRDDLLRELDETVRDAGAIQRVVVSGREILGLHARNGTPAGMTAPARLRITLGTIHRAKGLEFDEVLVAPSELRLEGDESHQCEERRVLYVACTRARERMTLLEGPRELALAAGKPYMPTRILAPVLTELKDIYLDAMVQCTRFRSGEELLHTQHVLHTGLRHEEELMLRDKVLHRIEEGQLGLPVGVVSGGFHEKARAFRERLRIDEKVPLSGLRVGAVIRREIEPVDGRNQLHERIREQGWFWLMVPYGVLRMPE